MDGFDLSIIVSLGSFSSIEAQSPSHPEHTVQVWAQLHTSANFTELLYYLPLLIFIYSLAGKQLKWKSSYTFWTPAEAII
jgi:hypothetical protein